MSPCGEPAIHQLPNMNSTDDEESSSDGNDLDGFQSHIYFELTDLAAELNRPLQRFGKHQRRLQYTCCDVFATEDTVYMALGTTSGSVYIFHSGGPRANSGRCSPSSASSFMSVPLSIITGNHATRNGLPEANNTWNHLLTVIAEDVVGSVSAVAFVPPTPDELSPLALDARSIMSDESESLSMPSTQSATLSMRRNVSADQFDHHERTSMDSNVSASNLYVSFSTSKGHFMIAHITRSSMVRSTSLLPIANWRPKTFERHWRMVYHCKTFTNDAVLLLRWQHFNRVFLVDQAGQLFLLQNIRECFSNIIFQPMPILLMNLNGVGICQMDVCEQFMLFSTTDQRVYLFDYNTMECRQIGKQSGVSKRKQNAEKQSGVCIFTVYNWDDDHASQDSNHLAELFDEELGQSRITHQLYVTRPKWRLWVVDHFGQVQFTQQFSELVQENVTTPISGDSRTIESIFELNSNLSSTAFERLYQMHWRDPDLLKSLHDDDISPKLLVTYSDAPHPRLFVIDPNQQAILACTAPLKGQFVDLKCLGRDIYVTYRTEMKELQIFVLTLCIESHIEELNNVTEESLQLKTSIEQIVNCSPKPTITIIVDETEERERARQKQFRNLLIRAWNCFGFTDEICWICSCGLPVAERVNFHHLNRESMIDEMQPLIDALDDTQQRQLMSVAATRHNWPLFFTLLCRLQECKLYLYYALLLDDQCMIDRSYNQFNSGTMLHKKDTWQDLVEYLCQYACSNDLTSNLEVPLEPIHLSPHLPSNARIVSTTVHCTMCQLKNTIQTTHSYKPLFALLEHKLLPYCFLHTSPDVVISLLKTVLNKLFRSSDGTPTQSYQISGNFFQLLLRFKLLYLGTNTNSRVHLDELITTVNAFSQPSLSTNHKELPVAQIEKILSSSKLSSERRQNSQRGLVINLRGTNCTFCNKPLLPMRTCGQPLLRKQLKLYRTCGHIYHNTCTLLSRACWLCSHNTSSHKTSTTINIDLSTSFT